MTADTLDLESLHAALDADPSDQFARRVLADWYEDAGDMVMAGGLREIATANRVPIRRERYTEPARSMYVEKWLYLWSWTRAHPGESPEDGGPACVVNAVFCRLQPVGQSLPIHDGRRETRPYETRQAAEEALCRALATK